MRDGVSGPDASSEVANPADLVEYRELVGQLLAIARTPEIVSERLEMIERATRSAC